MAGPSFWIDSRGCAKNQVDAEILVASLRAGGWERSEGPEGAAVLIVNSCGFIESAKKESIEALISLKNEFPGKKVVLAGCLSQRYADELAESLTEADGIFGNADLSKAPEFLSRLLSGSLSGARRAYRPEAAAPASGADREYLYSRPGSAYLKVAEGCSNHCSYCAIPLIRGNLRSREIGSVALEAAALESRGARELVLVGQDLGAFGADRGQGGSLPDLVEAVLGATKEAWIRVLYVHPEHFPEKLLSLARPGSRFLPYFDIPFQHVSGPLLAKMGRRGNATAHLELIEGIRSALPAAVLRSTFLLGFPGETEAEAQELYEFLEKARLDWAGFFSYSREEGTAAAAMKPRVPKREAKKRADRCAEIQTAISEARMLRFKGLELDALVEEIIREADDEEGPLSLARTYLQAPEVDGLTVVSGSAAPPGSMIKVKIVGAAGIDLDAVALEGAG